MMTGPEPSVAHCTVMMAGASSAGRRSSAELLADETADVGEERGKIRS
jgi:hypothetical protein